MAAMASRSWAQPKQTSVVLLLTGVITDGGWSQLAFNGLKSLGPGFKTAYAENIGLAQMQEVARGYSDDGFDLILGHGFEFSSALLDIAPDYPNQHFFVTSYLPQPKVPPNLLFINLGYFGAAYGAGALAALISEKKQVVGFVGGEDDPTQQRIERCFIAGARNTVKGIQGLGIITGDYDNAAKGREAASTLIGNGADVIWHAADVTGLGAIQGAVAGKAKVTGLLFRSDESGAEQHGDQLRDEPRRRGADRGSCGGQPHLRRRHGVETGGGLDVAFESGSQRSLQSAPGFCCRLGCVSKDVERSGCESDRGPCV